MRVSIRQVAEIAQVSPMTVTRVLRGQGFVADETRQRVLAAVRETEYVPVRSSVQNRHVSNYILGIVPYHVDVTRNRIDSETYSGICQSAQKNGYDLLTMLRGEADWMAGRTEARFLDRRCDGFLFISTGRGEWSTVLEALVRHKIPTVVCYRRDVPDGIAWIDPDNRGIVQCTVDALRQKGHRRIAFLTAHGYDLGDQGHLALQPTKGGNYDLFERRLAFLEITQNYEADNLFATVIKSSRPDWQLDDSVLDSIREQEITGVVCANDLVAIQLWRLATEAGLRIPEDLSITGVDNYPEAEQLGLTTVAFGYDAIGALAVEAWVRLAAGSPADQCNTVIPVTLYERKSITGPASNVGGSQRKRG